MSLLTSNMQKTNFKLWCIGVEFSKVFEGHMLFDRVSNDDLRYMSTNNGGVQVFKCYLYLDQIQISFKYHPSL